MRAARARAEKLLAEHLQQFLSNVKLADEKEIIRLREVILPYVNDAIRRASKNRNPMGGMG